jgi:hypothetical protein
LPCSFRPGANPADHHDECYDDYHGHWVYDDD